jgi:mevalonate kinase
VIADSGEKTPTHETVSDVRAQHTSDPETYDRIFESIGKLTCQAREALIEGDIILLGELMDENQRLLRRLGVSSDKLDHLIAAAKNAGAIGAKLSGGGRGGNIIAIASPEKINQIEAGLLDAGAHQVITTKLTKGKS